MVDKLKSFLIQYNHHITKNNIRANNTSLWLLMSMLWHRQAIFEWKRDTLSSFAVCRIWTESVSGNESPAGWMPFDKPTEQSSIKLKTWNWQPVPMISEHSAYSTPLPLAFAPGFGDTHVCCCLCRCSGTGKRFSNRLETSCLPLLNVGFELIGSLEPNLQQIEFPLTFNVIAI